MPTRRDILALLAGIGLHAIASARPQPQARRLVATWLLDDQHQVGVLEAGADGALDVIERLALPSRAHGLWMEPDGAVCVVARRPGDWLLRWHPATAGTTWHWITDDRRFNGHVMRSGDGSHLWTTETDQASGEGWIGVRDVDSLTKVNEWPTHGMDPHAMLILPESLGEVPAGSLIVANGGIPTQSETGRSHRQLDRMDPSLVAIEPGQGKVVGQWRLDDPRLSIRHLAFDPVTRRVGVALQAEHDDPDARAAAPLLAMWDGSLLRQAPAMPGSMGYGGDICPRSGGGFWLSATRANQVLGTDAQGLITERIALGEACALAAQGSVWWAAGARDATASGHQRLRLSDLRLDNHWIPDGGRSA